MTAENPRFSINYVVNLNVYLVDFTVYLDGTCHLGTLLLVFFIFIYLSPKLESHTRTYFQLALLARCVALVR